MANYREQIGEYLELEKKILDTLPVDDIDKVMNVLENARLSGKRIYTCGNGGSPICGVISTRVLVITRT